MFFIVNFFLLTFSCTGYPVTSTMYLPGYHRKYLHNRADIGYSLQLWTSYPPFYGWYIPFLFSWLNFSRLTFSVGSVHISQPYMCVLDWLHVWNSVIIDSPPSVELHVTFVDDTESSVRQVSPNTRRKHGPYQIWLLDQLDYSTHTSKQYNSYPYNDSNGILIFVLPTFM